LSAITKFNSKLDCSVFFNKSLAVKVLYEINGVWNQLAFSCLLLMWISYVFDKHKSFKTHIIIFIFYYDIVCMSVLLSVFLSAFSFSNIYYYLFSGANALCPWCHVWKKGMFPSPLLQTLSLRSLERHQHSYNIQVFVHNHYRLL